MKSDKEKSVLYNLRVLFVEDEDSARFELEKFLKRRVGKLYTAKNGEEGLKTFDESKPDLIITDLKMPIMNGLEMIKSIRSKGYDTPIIIISALSDSETILEAVDIGIVKYVIKPVNTDELINTMKKIASEILKNQLEDFVVVNDNILIDRKEKKNLEQSISSKIAHFIKSYTGKGPQNVHTFIQGNNISIKAKGILTVLEKSLIESNRNYTLVEYNRKLLYTEKRDELTQMIGKVLGSNVELIEVGSDSREDIDKINLVFK